MSMRGKRGDVFAVETTAHAVPAFGRAGVVTFLRLWAGSFLRLSWYATCALGSYVLVSHFQIGVLA